VKLHEKLRLYRSSRGITQTWLANQIGIPLKTLNGIELGRQRLSADMFELICRKGFDVNPGIFFKDGFLETKTDNDVSSFVPTGTED
jgi:transcriptional regulator with XRE-family HTH domain